MSNDAQRINTYKGQIRSLRRDLEVEKAKVSRLTALLERYQRGMIEVMEACESEASELDVDFASFGEGLNY